MLSPIRNETEKRGNKSGTARRVLYSLNRLSAWRGERDGGLSLRVFPRRAHLLSALLLALTTLVFVGCSEAPSSDARDASGTRGVPMPQSDVPANSLPPTNADADLPVIVFLGTSLTAGYGLEESQAFPALIQERIKAAGLEFRVINAGVSGDTSAGGLRRLDWLLRMPVGVLVLELGANDMLRGQGVDQLKNNLETILDRTQEVHPAVRFVVAGMRAAPNLGREYADRFDSIYPAVAERYDAALIPFLLEDVAARRNLNQADGIHPTVEGHALIAERVWKTLEPVLR